MKKQGPFFGCLPCITKLAFGNKIKYNEFTPCNLGFISKKFKAVKVVSQP